MRIIATGRRRGRGIVELEAAGEPVTVVNLAHTPLVPRALPVWESWLGAEKRGAVITDGGAAAVLGTHTHDPTLSLRVLPGGTALVTDIGMTGPVSGVTGFEPANFVSGFKEGNPFTPPPPAPADGPVELGVVLQRIEGGKTRRVERLR